MNVVLCVLVMLPAWTGRVSDWFSQLCLVLLALAALWLPPNPRHWPEAFRAWRGN